MDTLPGYGGTLGSLVFELQIKQLTEVWWYYLFVTPAEWEQNIYAHENQHLLYAQ